MMLTEYKRLLAAEMQSEADTIAIVNGKDEHRTSEEYRFNAGVSRGLERAVQIIEEFLKDPDDEEDTRDG